MADHDGHTINLGREAVDIDTGTLRAATAIDGTVPRVDLLALCDEVDRLRAENTALAAAIADIEGDVRAGHGNRLTPPP